MPSAGSLRERIRLEMPAEVDDGAGNSVQGWTARGDRWAEFLMRPGSEVVNAARLEGRQPVTILVRFDSLTRTVTPAWRVVEAASGQGYAIKAAGDLDRKRTWITLTCEAEVS